MTKLKTYENAQAQAVTVQHEPSGYKCPNCPGEMMIVIPRLEGWLNATTKNGLVRAVCGSCKWLGWV